MSDYYSHLLTNATHGLRTATCLYWDDVNCRLSLDDMMCLSTRLFNDAKSAASIAEIRQVGEEKSRRLDYIKLTKYQKDSYPAELSIYATSDEEISQNWYPPAYITFRMAERVKFVGLYYLSELESRFGQYERLLTESINFSAGAAYRFSYPLEFSPVAYINGLSYEPNKRLLGHTAYRDELRVAAYRDHRWRGKKASDGYLRDVYDIVLFNRATAARCVDGVNLVDWISGASDRGTVQETDGVFVWDTQDADRLRLQRDLDRNYLLLSGFEPEEGPAAARG